MVRVHFLYKIHGLQSGSFSSVRTSQAWHAICIDSRRCCEAQVWIQENPKTLTGHRPEHFEREVKVPPDHLHPGGDPHSFLFPWRSAGQACGISFGERGSGLASVGHCLSRDSIVWLSLLARGCIGSSAVFSARWGSDWIFHFGHSHRQHGWSYSLRVPAA